MQPRLGRAELPIRARPLPLLLLLGWSIVAGVGDLRAGEPWNLWHEPAGGNPTDASLRDVAYGGGVFIAVGGQGAIVRSVDGERWLPVDAAVSDDLLAVGWIEDRFVAVTDGLRTATSVDGAVWSEWTLESPPAGLLGKAATAYGDSYYLAVDTGYSGKIQTSRDGVHWAPRQLDVQYRLNGVAFGDHRFVVVGEAGTVLRSDPVPSILDNDRPVITPLADQEIDELSPWGAVVIAADPDPEDQLTYGLAPGSPLGMTINPLTGELSWNPQEEEGPATHHVGVWVHDSGEPPLCDAKWFSANVREVNAPPQFRPLPGVILDCEQTVVIEACDPDSPADPLRYELEEFPEGTLLNLTTRQFIWTPTAGQVGRVYGFTLRVTDDGSPPLTASTRFEVLALTRSPLTLEPAPLLRWHWVAVPQLTEPIWDLEFVDDRFFAFGAEGAVWTSPDGANWVRAWSGIQVGLKAACRGAGVFVVVGEQGTVLVSPDGVEWSRVDLDGAPDLTAVAYGADRFVALGGNPLAGFTSPDGTHWTSRGLLESVGEISDLIWTGNHFTAVGGEFNPSTGQTRTTLHSADGLTWIVDTRDGVQLRCLAQGDHRTVAVGGTGYLWASWGSSELSWDGIHWARNQDYVTRMDSVAYGDGRFVAAGVETGRVYAFHYFLVSRDGVFWEKHLQPEYAHADVLAYGRGRFVALARGGSGSPAPAHRVLVGTSTLAPPARSALRAGGWFSGFKMLLHGQTGVPYRVEVSEDLVGWREWQQVEGEFWGPSLTDPDSASLPQRFYRAVSPP